MFYTEWKAFIVNRRFLFLSLGPLLLAVIAAFSYYAANSVGLAYVNGYTFLIATANLYALLFLPFLGVAVGAHFIQAEFNWHTIRRPFVEHIPRSHFILGKAAIAAVALILLMVPYFLVCVLLASVLFGFGHILIEDQTISISNGLMRTSVAYLWSGFILYIFIILGQIILLRVRNTTVAILGSLLPYYIFVAFGKQLPLAPMRVMFQLSERILQSSTLNWRLGQAILGALATWSIITIILLILQVQLFSRQDVTTS
jgi:ABC-type transport system involved in multi-copper enzyme maturation permease subunit